MNSPRPPGAASPVPADVRFHAVVPAAGRGERFGGSAPKQFLAIAGRPILAWTIDRLRAAGATSIVVALPEESLDDASRWLAAEDLRLVAGGATRQASVAAALAASPALAGDLVAVHDGARAAVTPADVRAVVAAAAAAPAGGGAVLGRVVVDTIKELAAGRIGGTIDRARLFRAETPQVFRREVLERALARAERDRFVGTDESSLVERLGDVEITAVEACSPNPKLTVREDLEAMARLLAPEEAR
jgi:2-C-methyl-D-erythritol 4-phosphate cytidylyltransferase